MINIIIYEKILESADFYDDDDNYSDEDIKEVKSISSKKFKNSSSLDNVI